MEVQQMHKNVFHVNLLEFDSNWTVICMVRFSLNLVILFFFFLLQLLTCYQLVSYDLLD